MAFLGFSEILLVYGCSSWLFFVLQCCFLCFFAGLLFLVIVFLIFLCFFSGF